MAIYKLVKEVSKEGAIIYCIYKDNEYITLSSVKEIAEKKFENLITLKMQEPEILKEVEIPEPAEIEKPI